MQLAEKLASSFYAGVAATLAFGIAIRLCGTGWGSVLGLLFAFGTSNWSTNSANLWQHGPVTLLCLAALAVILDARLSPRPRTWPRYLVSGFVLGIAVFCRPLAIIPAVLIGIGIGFDDGISSLVAYAGGATPALAAALAYNLAVFGSVTGGYDYQVGSTGWTTPMIPGLLANLFSPSRGLFASSPFLLFAAVGFADFVRRVRGTAIAILLAAVAHALVISRWVVWWGGYCYGPRLMTDAIPFLFVVLCFGWTVIARKRWLLTGVLLAGGLSIASHGIGAISSEASWWNASPDLNRFPGRALSFRDAQPLAWARFWPMSFPSRFAAPWFLSPIGRVVWPGALDVTVAADAPAFTIPDPFGLILAAGPETESGFLACGKGIRLTPGTYRFQFDLRQQSPVSRAQARLELLDFRRRTILTDRVLTSVDLASPASWELPLRLSRRTLVEPRVYAEITQSGDTLFLGAITISRARD